MSEPGQAPDHGGLKQLCLSLRGELKRLLLARRMSESDADDLLQDLFVRLETMATGPIRAPKAYLYQMLNNLAHVHRRSQLRSQARDADWLYHQDEDNAVRDPETLTLARDHLLRLEQRLYALPERTTFILRRYRLDKMSQKAIAQELGISLSAVEKHLQRAYRAVIDIRQSLEGDASVEAEADGGADAAGR